MTDEHAIAEFIRTQTASLYRTAYLLTGDRVRAEDLMQDTLIRLFPRWSLVEEKASPTAYVRRALVNVYITGQRRADSRVVYQWHDPHIVDGVDPHRQIDDRYELRSLMHDLPERQRAALILRYVYDVSDGDIADALGCRAATVRSLISRGLRTVRAGRAVDPMIEKLGGPSNGD